MPDEMTGVTKENLADVIETLFLADGVDSVIVTKPDANYTVTPQP